jgi:hypothetical protein
MKKSITWMLVLLAAWVTGCNGAKEEKKEPAIGGYLDSAYVSKGYRAAMDSIHKSSGIAEPDFKLLQGYMREFRDSIQDHPTYRDLLDRAKGLKSMREAAVGMKVKSMSIFHQQKHLEVRIVMSFTNEMERALGGFRGEIGWLDETGKRVTSTPFFSVLGPIAAGDSVTNLRLEYAIYKPTGNELNDPRNQAKRDTMEVVEAIAKRKDLNALKFKVLDIRLANGLTPGRYWLKSAEERKQIDQLPLEKPKLKQLIKWADDNEDWVNKIKAHNSEYGLVISPVITERVEAGHGKNLVLDRIQKVQAYFNIQKRVPNSNMNKSTAGKRLVLAEYVDYWEWPMELRIYKQ